MYEALEELLIKYLDPSLIQKEDEKGESAPKENVPDEEKPVVIAVSGSSDRLRALKELLGSDYKGVFVKDMDSAAKFVEKNRK